MNDEKYILAGETQRSVTLTIDRARGTIYDCNFVPFTNTAEVYKGSITATPETVVWIEKNMNLDQKEQILERLKSGNPIIIEAESRVETTGSYFVKCGSYYADKTLLAPHIIGYLDSENSGVCGIEKAFEEDLKNEKAVCATYFLDARNTALLGVDPVISGAAEHDYKKGVVLTIDSAIQKICERVASERLTKGAIIVQDISTGEIKASVSAPSYSVFDLESAINSTDSPFVNRAFTAYNVGSVFKLCVAIAAIENGLDTDFSYECTGSLKIGSTVYNCNKHDGHGVIDMTDAIKNSCNTYFINLAMNTGVAAVYETANKLGFGKETVFADGFLSESGNLPELHILQEELGEFANLSFGQGRLLATPLQVNAMVVAIANGGLYIKPSLIKGTVDSNLDFVKKTGIEFERVMKKEAAEKLKSIMIETVKNGTGKNAQITSGAGGKTASAETGWINNGKTVTQCWFSGFFPEVNSKYAVTVLVEDGTSGSASAAPIFAEIAESITEIDMLS